MPIPDRQGNDNAQWSDALVSRTATVVCIEALGVSLRGAATGADLGGSSKYSNESLED